MEIGVRPIGSALIRSAISGTAMTSVMFVAECNTEYNAESNAGITINDVTLDGAKYSGTLTVSNPSAPAMAATLPLLLRMHRPLHRTLLKPLI